MRRFEYNKNTCDGWKSYPIRLTLERVSKCCSQPAVLVQSMEGGFVTANCFKCGKKDTLSEYEFKGLRLSVSCPECKRVMVPKLIENNYSYYCEHCRLYIRFADLLPHWKDFN